MSPVTHELDFYIPEDGFLHSHRRENLKSCIFIVGWIPHECSLVGILRELVSGFARENGEHMSVQEDMKGFRKVVLLYARLFQYPT
jgi:hypothetical protein